MQTMPLHQALSCALVLCPLLSACEPAAALGVRDEQFLNGGSDSTETRVLLQEDFEQAALTSPPWIVSGDVSVRTDGRSANKGVRLGRQATLEARLSTRGLRNVQVSFDARGVRLDLFEALRVEVAVDGHDYVPITRIQASRWVSRAFELPAMFSERAELRLRFQVIASDEDGHGGPFEGALIDNVTVLAERASSLDAGAPEVSDRSPSDASAIGSSAAASRESDDEGFLRWGVRDAMLVGSVRA